MTKTGVLIVNLGSPESTDVKDLRTYLDEFLMDKYVIDAPWLLRALIVKGFILPSRPKESAKAYKKIWTDEGSPLIVTTKNLRDKIAPKIEQPIELAMRYGNPSIKSGLEKLLQIMPDMDTLTLVPLYPHYAMSSFKTVVEKTKKELKKLAPQVQIDTKAPFYNDSQYLDVLAESIRPYWEEKNLDYLLFSYHGLPERHLRKTDPSGKHCLKVENCCKIEHPAHEYCYRHQCIISTEEVVKRLNIKEGQYGQAYQSRLGRDPWIQPFTDKTLLELAEKGVKRLGVVCPAFVSDCLETLEELGMEGKESFLEAGGEHFELIPCLNENEAWIDVLAGYCKDPKKA